MSGLRFHLHAAGVLAPGLASLPQLLEVCRGTASYEHTPLQLPSPALLPAPERRRASQVVRLVLACVDQALASSPFPAESLRSVFATDEGTGEVCQQMLETLATTRQVSPLLFPNSVQNAPSGYFSIAWRNREPATVVSLGLESFAAGLLCAVTDAAATRRPVLLVVYDPAMTSPLDELLPIEEATACAWIVSTGEEPAAAALATLELALAPAGSQPPSPLPAWLPASLQRHGSVRGIAALGLLAADAGSEMNFALGAQRVSLRRVAGAHA